MKKYDWNEERRKSVPPKEVCEPEAKTAEQDCEGEQTLSGKKLSIFKEKYKAVILAGRILVFLCPALPQLPYILDAVG